MFNLKRIFLPLLALFIFAAYTFSVMLQAQESLLDFGIRLMSKPDTAQVVIDLYLLAALACIWMYKDARSRGKTMASVIPYWLITALFVSMGPLLYLVVRGLQEHKAARSL